MKFWCGRWLCGRCVSVISSTCQLEFQNIVPIRRPYQLQPVLLVLVSCSVVVVVEIVEMLFVMLAQHLAKARE